MKWVTWDQAAVAAVMSSVVVLFLRRLRPARWSNAVIPAAREFAFISAIYSIWRVARTLPLVQDEGAIDRARQLAEWQDAMFLPTEASLQRFVIQHDWLAWFTTTYYAAVHVPSLIVFLVWLFVRHRDYYLQWRTALAVLTAFCLVIRFFRVAPPRFLPELGFVDLSTKLGLSVYGPVGTGVSDQFAAMPSIHVAWAAVVALGVFHASPSRWRWVLVMHLPVTIIVVAATGHHWWLDSIVAVVLLGVSLGIDRAGRRLGHWWRSNRPNSVVSSAAIDDPLAATSL